MFIIIIHKNQNRSPDVNISIHGCCSHRPVLRIDAFLPQEISFAGNFKQSVLSSARLRRMLTQFTGTEVLSDLTAEIPWSSGAESPTVFLNLLKYYSLIIFFPCLAVPLPKAVLFEGRHCTI